MAAAGAVTMPTEKYAVESRWGGSEMAPNAARLAELIAELETADEEHPDTWMTHLESGWNLRLDEERFAYLSDANLNAIGHMKSVSAAAALDLWLRFASGGPAAVERDPWVAGPRVFSGAEVAAIHERSRQITLEGDRQFFALLGPESPTRQCRKEGCSRGHVQYSALCARHHFEQIRGKPLPPELSD